MRKLGVSLSAHAMYVPTEIAPCCINVACVMSLCDPSNCVPLQQKSGAASKRTRHITAQGQARRSLPQVQSTPLSDNTIMTLATQNRISTATSSTMRAPWMTAAAHNHSNQADEAGRCYSQHKDAICLQYQHSQSL